MALKNADMPATPITDECGMPFNGLPAELATIGLTKRETFCLHMGVAETGDADLDAVIREGNRQKIAMHIASGILNGSEFYESASELMSKTARIADALLTELERTK